MLLVRQFQKRRLQDISAKEAWRSVATCKFAVTAVADA